MNKPYLSAKDAPDLSRFDWEDALRLEDQLTEDERMLRDAARTFAQEVCSRASSKPTVTKSLTAACFGKWGKPVCSV